MDLERDTDKGTGHRTSRWCASRWDSSNDDQAQTQFLNLLCVYACSDVNQGGMMMMMMMMMMMGSGGLRVAGVVA